ncbi:hypothetical protein DOI34_25050 [Salmonella enterica subsp. enterica serovar Virchow]|nr:hypothetical protein [Salmonella enterica subsp. enterica serovar Virchow]
MPLAQAAPNAIVVVTLALAIVLGEAARLSVDTRDIWLPPLLSNPIVFAGGDGFRVTLTENQALQCLAALAILVCAGLALQRSRSGRVWRAVSDDPLAAGLFGVDTRRTLALTVITGTAFATIAGAFAATHYGNISFGAGLIYGLKVLIVTAAGSYTSPVGAALGAAAFGLGESLWAGYFPLEWRDGWMLALLVAMLVLRRSGDAFQ